jgi:hypothetical protein
LGEYALIPDKLSYSKKIKLREIDSRINEAHKEISRLHTRLDNLTSERIAILKGEPKPRLTSFIGVASIELRPLIQEWIDSGSSLVELGRKSGLSESGIRSILSGRTKFTSARNADILLVALNATHIHLTEVANPNSAQMSDLED